jgi:hypothetical protein
MRWHVVLWKWEPGVGVERHYSARHVNHMAIALRAATPGMDVRVVCVTDDPTGISQCDTHPLWSDCDQLKNASGAHLPSCYRRLKLYDWKTQSEMGIEKGDRVVSLDLDVLVTGSLADVLRKEGAFVGWKLPGAVHDEVYNGSFQMFTSGTLRSIWSEFDPDHSPAQAKLAGFRGSDQAWLSMKLAGKPGCANIPYPSFASYPLHCRKLGYFSVKHRLVFFHGKMKPWDPKAATESNWIRRYWREEHALSE